MTYFCSKFQVIVFVFTSFDLEYEPLCTSDSLTLFDGESVNARPIEKYCGSDAPQPVSTSGNVATMLFITGATANKNGFSVIFVATDSAMATPVPGGNETTPAPTTFLPPSGERYFRENHVGYSTVRRSAYNSRQKSLIFIYVFTVPPAHTHSLPPPPPPPPPYILIVLQQWALNPSKWIPLPLKKETNH